MTGRLIVLTIDQPYPPNYGHKVDQYHRWRGFAANGWTLRLICWRSPQDPPAAPDAEAKLAEVFDRVDELPIGYDFSSMLRRLCLLLCYPSHVASRVPHAATRRRLIAEAREFAPDAIILDGIYGGVLGSDLARACGVPVIVRGHNIEHVYFAGQVRATANIARKFKWSLALLGLKRYESAVLRQADWTFDISADDVRFWQDRGITRISWSPTVYPGDVCTNIIDPGQRQFDVAYIGNLRLPNNLAGLTWFVREVLPLLRAARPETTYCFAGANPSPEAIRLFAEAPEITLVPDAPSADEILKNGRVLVNPILSGSGVNVKSIDMLRYDAPIVTTAIGAQGFDETIRGEFTVCNDAPGFAAAIIAALADPRPPAGREAARALFGSAGLEAQMAMVSRIIAQGRHRDLKCAAR